MDPERQKQMQQVLAKMWAENRPTTLSRVDQLDAAVNDLASGALTEAQRESAEQTAHKLAGVLGTYGLRDASLSAREVEVRFAEEDYDVGKLRALLSLVRAAVQQ